MVQKPGLLRRYGGMLAKAVFFSLLGLVAGFRTTMSPFVVMCVYTTLVASFALILAYVENFLQAADTGAGNRNKSVDNSRATVNTLQIPSCIEDEDEKQMDANGKEAKIEDED